VFATFPPGTNSFTVVDLNPPEVTLTGTAKAGATYTYYSCC